MLTRISLQAKEFLANPDAFIVAAAPAAAEAAPAEEAAPAQEEEKEESDDDMVCIHKFCVVEGGSLAIQRASVSSTKRVITECAVDDVSLHDLAKSYYFSIPSLYPYCVVSSHESTILYCRMRIYMLQRPGGCAAAKPQATAATGSCSSAVATRHCEVRKLILIEVLNARHAAHAHGDT